MEEDLRSLRKKIRKLEEAAGADDNKRMKIPIPESESKPSTVDPTHPDESTCTGGINLDDKIIIIKNLKGDQERFKYLCKLFFTEKELVDCSRTGKRTVKCADNPRPPLNGVQFSKLRESVQKYCSFDKDLFHKKFENFQKVLRKSASNL